MLRAWCRLEVLFWHAQIGPKPGWLRQVLRCSLITIKYGNRRPVHNVGPRLESCECWLDLSTPRVCTDHLWLPTQPPVQPSVFDASACCAIFDNGGIPTCGHSNYSTPTSCPYYSIIIAPPSLLRGHLPQTRARSRCLGTQQVHWLRDFIHTA
jgi:hypothetical protein